jgi:hypothetical protein
MGQVTRVGQVTSHKADKCSKKTWARPLKKAAQPQLPSDDVTALLTPIHGQQHPLLQCSKSYHTHTHAHTHTHTDEHGIHNSLPTLLWQCMLVAPVQGANGLLLGSVLVQNGLVSIISRQHGMSMCACLQLLCLHVFVLSGDVQPQLMRIGYVWL